MGSGDAYPLRFALPNVALGSAPLRGHRMTFSHSSKDPLRPLTQGDKVDGHTGKMLLTDYRVQIQSTEYRVQITDGNINL